MSLTKEERIRILGEDSDTAADVIQERDQLKERVRELEAAKAKYENMLSALLIHGQPKGELEERIAKAREILQREIEIPSHESSIDGSKLSVQFALEALEGK